MKYIICIITAFLVVSSLGAATLDLDKKCEEVAFLKKERIENVFYSLGRTYGVTFVLDEDVVGDADIDISAGHTLREVLDVITFRKDLYYTIEANTIFVKRYKTVIYEVYASATKRTASSSTLIQLSSASSNSTSSNYGTNVTSSQNGQTYGNNGGRGAGTSSITITESNEADFWTALSADMTAYMDKGEKVIINPNSGKVTIIATPRRQKVFADYFANVNESNLRQVDIQAQILTVELNENHKLGIDYSLAATKAGSISFNSLGTSSAIGTVGGQEVSANSFAANIGAGKVTALINALQEQGEVRSLNNPQVRCMNNQIAYLVVGREQGFFTLSTSQSIESGGTTTPIATEKTAYNKETLTFGTIFSVTPKIFDGYAILDVKPEHTSLVGVKPSPDGKQETPITDVQKAGTRLLMRDGETIVFAGLSSSSKGSASKGAPGLSSLPVVGRLFGTRAEVFTRSDMVIILTVHIRSGGNAKSTVLETEGGFLRKSDRPSLGAFVN